MVSVLACQMLAVVMLLVADVERAEKNSLHKKRMRSILNLFDFALRKIFEAVIKLYRLLISPFLGNNCRFHPTCSRYAIDALNTKTFFQAILLIIKRISKCHPFHNGGYDPVK